jgi:hypothetical protein
MDKEKYKYTSTSQYGRCALFPLFPENNRNYSLVDGNLDTANKDNLYFCSTARDYESMCGVNATRFVKYSGERSSQEYEETPEAKPSEFEPWRPEVRIMPKSALPNCFSRRKTYRFVSGALRKLIRKWNRS